MSRLARKTVCLGSRALVARMAIALVTLATGTSASAGSLDLYESSVSPGAVRVVATPASAEMVDVHYDAPSAEGGGLFGLSEIAFYATGDVSFDAAGFSCQLSGCMVNPEVFASGQTFTVTGGDDLNGSFLALSDLVTFRVSGTNGYVVIAAGEYLDATGAAASIGAVQTVDPTILVRVPEPGFGVGVAGGLAALGFAARMRRPRMTERS